MDIIKHELEPIPRQIETVSENDEVYLSVQIGNGQIGGNIVTLNDQLLAKGNLTQPTFIGKASDLRNREMRIETNVLDVNAFTNLCVITTTFYNQQNSVLFSKIDKGNAPENGIASFRGKYILLSLTILFFFLGLFNSKLLAQNEGVPFQKLETPSSPGLILLDQAPSSIEKPTTPQGFGLSILGFFQGKGGAMELAPFWLFAHPNLSAKKMNQQKLPVLYNLSVSVATVQSDSSDFLSGGLRTRLFQSFGKSQKHKLDSLENEIINELSQSIDNIDLDKIEGLCKAYVGTYEKPVFNIDFAAALAGGSGTSSFKDLDLNRWAAWLSLNWRPKGDDFYITALSRYIDNEKFEDYTVKADLVDLGSRINYDIAKLCLSLEYLQRLNFTDSKFSDYRVAVIGSYRISETFYITSTFGKNFTDVNNIIALAGINIGFSKSKIKAY